MKLSSSCIMSLRSDLCFVRNYLRELESKENTWQRKLLRALIRSCTEEAEFKINGLHALVHVFSKTLEVARAVNKDKEDEDELFFSLLDLCESIKDEIAAGSTHDPKFIQVLVDLNSRFDDDSWEQINGHVDRIRRMIECGKT